MNQGTGFLEYPAAEPGQGAAVGQVLGGRYEVGSLLGHGGMAEVYAAQDRVLDRQVAVKVLRAGGGHSVAERQSAEARILARLDHPHLVRVFDADTDPTTGRPFLVMELVHGGTLTELLDAGPLPTTLVAALGEQLAGALAAIHQAGIVHRDVKPSNVLLAHPDPGAPLTGTQPGDSEDTRTGNTGTVNTDPSTGGLDARLTDFGIARVLDATRITTTGLLIGTAAYLSPEQARGDAVGCPSDVYSLGLVLLECLTGHPEYPGGPLESALARLNRQPLIPDDLGPHWVGLLTAMTAPDPTDRPTADQAAAALGALGDLSHGQPPTLTPTAAQPLPAPAHRTHPVTPTRTDDSHTDRSQTDHGHDRSAGTLRREPRGAGWGRGRLARRCGAAVAVAAALITAVTLTGSPDATPTPVEARAGTPPTSAPTGATNAQPAPTRGRASTTSAAAAATPLTTGPAAATSKRTSTGTVHVVAARRPGTSRAAGSPASGKTPAKLPTPRQTRPVPTGKGSATTKPPTAAPASAGSPTAPARPVSSPSAAAPGAGKSTNPKSHAHKPKKPKSKGKGNPHGR